MVKGFRALILKVAFAAMVSIPAIAGESIGDVEGKGIRSHKRVKLQIAPPIQALLERDLDITGYVGNEAFKLAELNREIRKIFTTKKINQAFRDVIWIVPNSEEMCNFARSLNNKYNIEFDATSASLKELSESGHPEIRSINFNGIPPYADSNFIACFPGLERVCLDYTSVDDILWLEKAPKLKILNLSGNKLFKDVSTLTGLQNLEELYLSEVDVEDISPLTHLPNLRILEVSDAVIIAALASLSLTSLNLSDNKFFKDVSKLEELQVLTNLDLSYTGIESLPALNIPNLRFLNLSGTNIKRVATLIGLQSLEELHLCGTPVENVAELRSIPKLSILNLSDNKFFKDVSDLEGLQALTNLDLSDTGVEGLPVLNIPNLRMLDLSRANIKHVATLIGLQSLERLYLCDTPVEDVAELKSIPKLHVLDVSGTNIKCATTLIDLQNLEELYLHGAPVENVAELRHLQKLRVLELSWTSIKRITTLIDLKNLEELYLYGASVENVAELRHLQKLRIVNVSNNFRSQEVLP